MMRVPSVRAYRVAETIAVVKFLTDFDPEYGSSVTAAPGIRRLVCPNPGPFTFTGTGTYAITSDVGAVIIDPGPDHVGHLSAAAVMAGSRPVAAVLVTHRHADHAGGARAFADRVEAPVLAAAWSTTEQSAPHPKTAESWEDGDGIGVENVGDATHFARSDEAVVDLPADRYLSDRDILNIGGLELEVVATPGHIRDHVCFVWRRGGAVFSGDHVMGWSTSVLPPPHGHLEDYLRSLKRIGEFGDLTFFPTHGPPIPHAGDYVEELYAHRMMRTSQILDALSRGDGTIEQIVRQIYVAINPLLIPAACLSVWAHLEMLVDQNVVVVVDGLVPTLTSRYRLST